MILLTGSSGFLGKILKNHFDYLGMEVKTIGRNPGDDYLLDLAKGGSISLKSPVDLVVHCAGKAHSVPKTTSEREAFFNVNVLGTQNLLHEIQKSGCFPKSFVLISTVAVYGQENGRLINEQNPLLANDAYGLSKIRAEELVRDWCVEHRIVCTILRLPLIAGANPPGNLQAMIKGIKKGYYFNIAGGNAKKSIVLAQDVAEVIPRAALIGGTYNLTDGIHPKFSELSAVIAAQLEKSKPLNIPLWLANLMALAGNILGDKSPINKSKLKKITSDLTFDDTHARRNLAWAPKSVIKEFRVA